ncbi:hypothetical protein ACWDTD_18205 [Gordonia sp. NPDC003425]
MSTASYVSTPTVCVGAQGGARAVSGRVTRAGVTAALMGAAAATSFALVAPSATAAGVAPALAPLAAVTEFAPKVAAPVSLADNIVTIPSAGPPIGEFGRHDVATSQQIGTSTAVGAGVGAVIGFGIGVAAAPFAGAIAVAVVPAIGTVVCSLGSAAATVVPVIGTIGTLVPCAAVAALATTIAFPVTAIATPLVGAAIGAAIGAGVGAGVGSTYADATVPAPVQTSAPLPTLPAPVADLTQKVAAPVQQAVTPLENDPTVRNIRMGVDRAVATNPQLSQIAATAHSLLPSLVP